MPESIPIFVAISPAEPEPVLLCASAELVDSTLEGGGHGKVFDVLEYGTRASAFALRFEGRVVAYMNRCLHVPVTLDWAPGEFLDDDRRWILCSVHGAAYEPRDGRCIAGPCGRGTLAPVRTEERDGQVYWYPSRDIKPAPPKPPALPESPR